MFMKKYVRPTKQKTVALRDRGYEELEKTQALVNRLAGFEVKKGELVAKALRQYRESLEAKLKKQGINPLENTADVQRLSADVRESMFFERQELALA